MQQLHLFGSVVTDQLDPARSDVDAVVSFPPGLDLLTAANACSTCGTPRKNSSAGAWTW
ncbi:nucleotidyltransferase domain-containing protein [Hymenobacter sp. PAMC 26628]|uniref:nucleotidyltransferase domain-containing protein n=1 Tax=Hymenobacter sp. PAMC 26628 TaxID=1484118 RepID=UPI000B1624B4